MMEMFSEKCRWINAISVGFFLSSLLVLFYIWNWGSPLQIDDFYIDNCLFRTSDGMVHATGEKINTFSEFLQTVYLHRSHLHTGRLADVFACLLHCVGGKWIFNYINTIVCACILLFCAREYFGKISVLNIVAVAVSLYLLLPVKGSTILWLCGSCNYFWGTLIYLFFLKSIKSMKSHKGGENIILPSILAFLCGIWHEGIGLPLAAALASYWLYVGYRFKVNDIKFLFIAFFVLLGTALVISSPVAWNKGHKMLANTSVFFYIFRGGQGFFRYCFFNLITLAVILFFKRKTHRVSINLLFLAFSAGLAFATSQGGGMGRGYYFFGLSSAIWLWESLPQFNLKRESLIGMCGVLICVLVMGDNALHAYRQRLFFEEILKKPTDSAGCLIYQSMSEKDPCLKYSYSLPPSPDEQIRDDVARKYNRDSFWFYVRRSRRNVDEYKNLAAIPEDGECHVGELPDHYAIRLPWLNAIEDAEILKTRTSDGRELFLRNRYVGWSFLRKCNAKIRGDELDVVEFDYYEGHYYILIPKRLEISDEISFRASIDKGKAPREFFVKLPR